MINIYWTYISKILGIEWPCIGNVMYIIHVHNTKNMAIYDRHMDI